MFSSSSSCLQMKPKLRLLLTALTLLQAFTYTKSQPYIGVNYGEVADNLPPPTATARLLESTTIANLRLYGADPAVLTALANTNISVVVGVANSDIPSLASDPSAASRWISANVLPFLPATLISIISVGNEVLNSGDAALSSALLPAMQNVHAAAPNGIKISTVHTMAVLSSSDPPSSGAFHSDIIAELTSILQFLQSTGSPFMINPYPYFAYQSDPRPETLAFCLFQPNAGRTDSGSGVTYTNMFDSQVDAVAAAVKAAGLSGVEIVVAETGWPYRGDGGEAGATAENARAFVGGLVGHLRSGGGTPMMPGRAVETYIFALYDEDLKPGPLSERSFGLFHPDLTVNIDAGLMRSASPEAQVTPGPPSSPVAPRSCVRQDDKCQQSTVGCTLPGVGCNLQNTTASNKATFSRSPLCCGMRGFALYILLSLLATHTIGL